MTIGRRSGGHLPFADLNSEAWKPTELYSITRGSVRYDFILRYILPVDIEKYPSLHGRLMYTSGK